MSPELILGAVALLETILKAMGAHGKDPTTQAAALDEFHGAIAQAFAQRDPSALDALLNRAIAPIVRAAPRSEEGNGSG